MSKLLIVDDENDVREFASNFFRKRNIDVITAGSGEEAIQKVQSEKPDLILLDVKMSGISGIQALEEIRKLDAAVKVIMVTGTKPEENSCLERCTQMGIVSYIHKPLRLDELEQVVMSTLCP
jgi:two-component system, response regulator, stage 0 sporulation protein F